MYVSDIGELPTFFDKYILLNSSTATLEESLIKHSSEKIFKPFLKDLEKIGDKVYAPNKWTVKQIVQHCIDTERIMAYRALAFARGESNHLPGFDENLYAQNADVEHLTLEDLVGEFAVLRMSTLVLFENIKKENLLRKGTASKVEISPLALGFVITGHPLHHLEVIKERYLPLL
jgi:DinB superfamily